MPGPHRVGEQPGAVALCDVGAASADRLVIRVPVAGPRAEQPGPGFQPQGLDDRPFQRLPTTVGLVQASHVRTQSESFQRGDRLRGAQHREGVRADRPAGVAGLAVGDGEDLDARPGRGEQRQQAADAENLVVGVGRDDDRPLRRGVQGEPG